MVARTRGFPLQALSDSGFLAGEMVVLSLEGQQPQAARAWVHALTAGSLTLALQRPLRAGLLQQGQARSAGQTPSHQSLLESGLAGPI